MPSGPRTLCHERRRDTHNRVFRNLLCAVKHSRVDGLLREVDVRRLREDKVAFRVRLRVRRVDVRKLLDAEACGACSSIDLPDTSR